MGRITQNYGWDNEREIKKCDEMKNWFFENINKTEKPLASLTHRKRDLTKLIKSEMKSETLQQMLFHIY